MGKDVWNAILFGLINTFMVVPVSVSFCSIIFRDDIFNAYLPSLVKLVLFSSAIHQLCFSMFSSLPFAVGQVQDAGLIFLSAMSGSIARSCNNPENIVPTTLFILGSSTAILGVMLIIVSKLRLASLVQYLPMPVIGGYLAFIGFFCGEAGLSMMAGVQVTNLTQWNRFMNRDAFVLMLPGLVAGLLMSYLLHKIRSPLTFPLCLLSILAIFFGVMLLSGSSFEDMRNAGWISPLDEAGSSFDAWKLYDINKVEWHHFPDQIPTLLGMFFVVAFSSSLDVAAIEMELGLPLDYNRELNTVGISNLVSGLMGGFTGSYIFTQTTFNMRRGIDNRLCGYIIVGGELVIALLPVSVISFIPKLFFGSLLVLIATELLCEWLIFARNKMMMSEYLVCLLTFACIQAAGIELGMLIGVIAAMFSFVISYSSVQSVSAVVVKSSTVIRTFEERRVLLSNRGKVVTVSLNGYLFFGSAVKLLQEIKAKLVLSDTSLEEQVSPKESVSSPMVTQNSLPADSRVESSLSSLQMGEKSSLLATSASKSIPISSYTPSSTFRSSFSAQKSSYQSIPNCEEATASSAQKRSSAFEAMTPLREKSRRNLFGSPAPTATPAKDDGALSHSHHPIRLVYSSSAQRHHHIPTVYDMTAEQIRSHYESWTAANSVSHGNGESGTTLGSSVRRPSIEKKSHTAHTSQGLTTGVDIEMGKRNSDDTKKFSSSHQSSALSDNVGNSWLIGEDLSSSTSAPSKSSQGRIPPKSNLSPMLLAEGKTESRSEDQPSATSPVPTQSPQDLNSISVLIQLWEGQQQRKEQKRMRSLSDLINTTSPSRNSLISQNDCSTTDIGVSKRDGVPLLRESSYTKDGFQNNRPVVHGMPALALQSAVPPPEYIFPSFPEVSVSSSSRANAAVGDRQIPLEETENENTAGQETVTEYLVLDFTGVMGVDATAARACFLTLVQFMRTANVNVIFAHLSPTVEDLLRAHNVVHDESIVIPNLDDALEWCEDQILVSNRLKEPGSADTILSETGRRASDYSKAWKDRQSHSQLLAARQQLSDTLGAQNLRDSMASNLDLLSLAGSADTGSKPISARALRRILADYLGLDLRHASVGQSGNRFKELLESSTLTKYFTREHVAINDVIFDVDELSTKVFFIEKGTVEIVSLGHENSQESAESSDVGSGKHEVVRVSKASHGGVFGEADFILGKTRSVRAYAVTDCTFWVLDRGHFALMEVQMPQLCLLLQYALLRSLALSYTCSLNALHPSTAFAARDDDDV